MGEMSRSVVGIYMAYAIRFSHFVYLNNKASEQARKTETSEILADAPQCYGYWNPTRDASLTGTLVLDKKEYFNILSSRFELVAENTQPTALIVYGDDAHETTVCSQEVSHVPYFEALWRRKC